MRIGENIIGAANGVVKARDVWRRAVDEMWSHSRLMTVKGHPWRPVPLTPGDRIPISIDERGRAQIEADNAEPDAKIQSANSYRR